MLCAIANSGAFRLPLAVAIIILMALGYYTDYTHKQKEFEAHSADGNPGTIRSA